MFMKKMSWIITTLALLTGFSLSAMNTTGSSIRVKKIAFVSVKVYSITHQMKDLSAKDAKAIIDAETDKKFTIKMLRDIDSAKIVNAINEAFDNNGYKDKAKKDQFSSVLKGDMNEGDVFTISYNAGSKTTSLTYNGNTSNIPGEDFMKATWSIWFGKIDQPQLTKDLMSKMP
jgi:hypothetical protein